MGSNDIPAHCHSYYRMQCHFQIARYGTIIPSGMSVDDALALMQGNGTETMAIAFGRYREGE